MNGLTICQLEDHNLKATQEDFNFIFDIGLIIRNNGCEDDEYLNKNELIFVDINKMRQIIENVLLVIIRIRKTRDNLVTNMMKTRI